MTNFYRATHWHSADYAVRLSVSVRYTPVSKRVSIASNICNMTTQRCPRDQKQNRKLIRMTSSVERREQMWVVLSDYLLMNSIVTFSDNSALADGHCLDRPVARSVRWGGGQMMKVGGSRSSAEGPVSRTKPSQTGRPSFVCDVSQRLAIGLKFDVAL